MGHQRPASTSGRGHRDACGQRGIDVIRVSYPDLIGVDRGRDVLIDELPTVMGHGIAFCRAVFHTSPRGDVVPIQGGLESGLPDIKVVPDLTTLTDLPWEPGAAWCLGDTFAQDGAPRAESPREVAAGSPHGSPSSASPRSSDPSSSSTCASRRPRRASAGSDTRTRPATSTWSVARATRRACCCRCCATCATPASGHRGQPRVQRGPVRDQPQPLRARRRRGPRVPARSRPFRRSRGTRGCWPPSWPSPSTTRAAAASTCTCPWWTATTRTCSATRRGRRGYPRSAAPPSPASWSMPPPWLPSSTRP